MLIAVALILGVALLAKAADEFVEGAARLAVMLKISPIVVGAVIVGFGTSAPEMVVSGIAAGQGDDDLGIGNIIGSNLANLSLILGAAALIVPLTIDSRVLKKEMPLATGAVILFAILVQNGLSVTDGVIFLVLLVAALLFLLLGGDGDSAIAGEVEELAGNGDHTIGGETIRTLIGLTGTVAGAWLLVWGATTLAEDLGINEGFVGVTLVAIGTSLPELVTAIAAARQNQTDLIIGNLLGSNLFNSLAVGAVVAFLGDGSVVDPSLTGLDLWFMLAVCLLGAAAMFTRSVLERAEGTLLLGVFIGFLIATWWDETQRGGEALIELSRGLI
jgi:cation:H+ antiporter